LPAKYLQCFSLQLYALLEIALDKMDPGHATQALNNQHALVSERGPPDCLGTIQERLRLGVVADMIEQNAKVDKDFCYGRVKFPKGKFR
jgi:hypothetical protein